jgi:hypothetical protein
MSKSGIASVLENAKVKILVLPVSNSHSENKSFKMILKSLTKSCTIELKEFASENSDGKQCKTWFAIDLNFVIRYNYQKIGRKWLFEFRIYYIF